MKPTPPDQNFEHQQRLQLLQLLLGDPASVALSGLLNDRNKLSNVVVSGALNKDKKKLMRLIKRSAQVRDDYSSATIFDDTLALHIINRSYDAIDRHFESVSSTFKLSKHERPILSTLPNALINARVIFDAEINKHIIFFNRGLPLFCNMISKIIARAFAPLVSDGILAIAKDDLRANLALFLRTTAGKELIRDFTNLTYACVKLRDPYLSYPYILNEGTAEEQLSALLRDTMELFVVAHERGHLAAGHLNGSGTLAVNSLANQKNHIVEIDYGQRKEFEADQIGCAAVCLIFKPLAQPAMKIFYFWGICCLFLAHESLLRADAKLTGQPVATGETPTHPSLADRLENLCSAFCDFREAEAPMCRVLTNRVIENTRSLFLALEQESHSMLSTITIPEYFSRYEEAAHNYLRNFEA